MCIRVNKPFIYLKYVIFLLPYFSTFTVRPMKPCIFQKRSPRNDSKCDQETGISGVNFQILPNCAHFAHRCLLLCTTLHHNSESFDCGFRSYYCLNVYLFVSYFHNISCLIWDVRSTIFLIHCLFYWSRCASWINVHKRFHGSWGVRRRPTASAMDAYTHAYNHAPRSSGDSPHRNPGWLFCNQNPQFPNNYNFDKSPNYESIRPEKSQPSRSTKSPVQKYPTQTLYIFHFGHVIIDVFPQKNTNVCFLIPNVGHPWPRPGGAGGVSCRRVRTDRSQKPDPKSKAQILVNSSSKETFLSMAYLRTLPALKLTFLSNPVVKPHFAFLNSFVIINDGARNISVRDSVFSEIPEHLSVAPWHYRQGW